jgi:hypothetical protein
LHSSRVDRVDLPLERRLKTGSGLTRAPQAYPGTEKGDGSEKKKRVAFRGRHRQRGEFHPQGGCSAPDALHPFVSPATGT